MFNKRIITGNINKDNSIANNSMADNSIQDISIQDKSMANNSIADNSIQDNSIADKTNKGTGAGGSNTNYYGKNFQKKVHLFIKRV